jgi:hypothetical protein
MKVRLARCSCSLEKQGIRVELAAEMAETSGPDMSDKRCLGGLQSAFWRALRTIIAVVRCVTFHRQI